MVKIILIYEYVKRLQMQNQKIIKVIFYKIL